jgi:hypothetical protein
MEQEHSTIVTNAMQTRSKKTRDHPLPTPIAVKQIPLPAYMYAPGQQPQIATMAQIDDIQELVRQGYNNVNTNMKRRTRKMISEVKRARANASGASVAPSKKRKKFK